MKSSATLRLFLLFSLLSAPAATLAADANWPQWRGPASLGVSPERNIPDEWGPAKNVKWKTAIPGKSHSSPIVWGKRVFLTTAVEGETVPGAKAVRHVTPDGKDWMHPDSVGADKKHSFRTLALDRDTGKVIWERTAWEGNPYDDRHRKSSYAASTPATDGRTVFAYFGPEGLYAYDFDGKLLWKADVGRIGSVGLGTGTSPVLYENLVIIQGDSDFGENSSLVALDKRTGKEVWRVARKVQVSWATPILVRTAKRTELVTSGAESVVAYDPATGKELWRSKGLGSNAIPSPVAASDMVYLFAGFPVKITYAIRLGASGDVTDTPNVAWQYAKGTAYVPSPILYNDLLYLMSDKGILTALDAKSGKIVYEGGRVPVPAAFTASPVAADGRLFLTSEDGDTFVVRAGPVHEVVRTNTVGEPVYASPAIAAGKIFIRGERHLYCIGK
ncbi:MAG TPA: PQQ-binding-like beta-propeller repeat protein [Pyrinomonadaceae bacterium]|nr:PQQ-binding-like beta-propeller repeat protein [Pyrinomonadaceae bacterium]